jgi:hypothetical protein
MDHYCAPKVVINPGDVGASCMANGDCHSNLCATLGMQRFCTQSCKIGDMCPNGLVCTNFGTDGFLCAPPSGGNGGGGCALAPSSRRGAADLWLGLVAILGFGATLKRRRRRA